MHLLLILYFPSLFAEDDVLCPHERSLVVDTALVFSSDEYRGLPISYPPCTFTIRSSSGTDLMVSITTSSSISLRRPVSSRDLIIRDEKSGLMVNREPKTYRLFSSPITVDMPLSLSFRAVIVVSALVDCDQKSFRCGRLCDFGATQNCSSACIQKSLVCDTVDNCYVDEAECGHPVAKLAPSGSSFRYQTILSSSQLMLVGFLVLNGAFIAFFLGLSVCSVSACFSRKVYREKSRASRMTFVKYLREASSRQPSERSPSPPRERRSRPTILSRLNFEPSPILRELEPEVEDRTIRAPREEICCLPSYQSQLYSRRQSLPVPRTSTQPGRLKWKRTSVGAHY
ncbi:hypothetical protein Y032_0049g1873 [Ancylostoma ceylanicum]|uniref:Uncharacterized protein n=1 Tax=Ancylostoma ceylanicum TaxID=53326 RepID=A0A016U9X2_9BILA|nr:hypothetical protein Y032_0049g1873 [Ancylostoma ceylanicum]